MNKNKYSLQIKCPCNSSVSKFFYEYKKKPKLETNFNLEGQQYLRYYKQCISCKHLFAYHNIDLSNLYNNDYLDATYSGVAGMKKRFDYIMKLPLKKSDNKQRVKRILNFLKSYSSSNSKNLLDVGAGTGVFAKSFQLRKWNVHTIETDLRTVNYLNGLGIRSINKDIRKIKNFGKVKFDLITFNKVLEHVEEPISLLKSSLKFLKKNSLVYLEVPDVSASIQGKNREEFFIDHHHIFSVTSASIMVQKAGLHVKQISSFVEPSGKYTIALFASN